MFELRPWQERGVLKIVNEQKGRSLIWVPMGKGKTPIAAKVSAVLACRRILVQCKESGVAIWTRKTSIKEKLLGRDWLELFTQRKVVVHNMEKMSLLEREVDWNKPTNPEEVHVYVVIYNTFARDMGAENRKTVRKRKKGEVEPRKVPLRRIIGYNVTFDILIADECKRLSNKDSSFAIATEQILYNNKRPILYLLQLSGTPGDKGPPSFWEYWRLIDRKKFSSYWAYIDHFCTTIESVFGQGKEIVEQRIDTKPEWDRLLNRYAFIVSDTEASEGAPPLDRQKVFTTLLPDQQKLYDDIRHDMISVTNNYAVIAQNPMVQMLRLRQILVCPKILGEEFSCGGAIKTFCDLLEDENETERHTVIFTPFTAAFDPFTRYLNERGFREVYHIQGGISSNQLEYRINAFRRSKGIILCSTQYAEAFSLEPATKGWAIGFDYSPDVNSQAEKRLHRFTTTYPVMINYFSYNTPTDDRMVDIVAIKQEKIDFSMPENIVKLIRGEL